MFDLQVADRAMHRQQTLLQEARHRSLLREARVQVKPLLTQLLEVFRPLPRAVQPKVSRV